MLPPRLVPVLHPVPEEVTEISPPETHENPQDTPQDDAVDVLARTIYGEARGEGLRGMEAVACVVMNRVRHAQNRRAIGARHWWGDHVAAVCRKPFQFSCWNTNDPNRDKLFSVSAEDALFAICRRVARRAVASVLDDVTRGATHYHAKGVFPLWARGRAPSADIGNHLFYNQVR
ncbi:MAG: cell wall hydrolase [Alphaproteobacteria bacterium]|nr:cell wall hydrolase [Alphaproteobacteria bacterium]